MKRLKNITLVTLILISVLLFSRVWFGANFVKEIKKNITFARTLRETETKNFTIENVLTPEKIIVTGGGKRNVILKGRDEYEHVYKYMKSAIGKLEINAEYFFETDSDDWTTALKSRSVLFDFAASYDSGLIEKLGINLPNGEYKNIVFVPSDSIVADTTVYIKNNEKIYKFVSNGKNTELESIIKKYAVASDAMNSPFAFELGFDKAKTNTEISQNILLDSTTVMGLTERYVSGAVCKTANEGFTQKSVERLLETFKFNRNTTKRYIDKDDVTVYVDNTATLKIYPSYMIEYTSENGGYSLSDAADKKSSSAYISEIYSVAREVFKAAEVNDMPMLAYADINSETSKSDMTVTFDYYLNGMPILANDAEHGIIAVIKDGTLKTYKQFVFDAELSEGAENIGSMINAIDLLYEKFKDEKEVRLSDIFTAYMADTETFELKPVWCAKFGNETVVVDE